MNLSPNFLLLLLLLFFLSSSTTATLIYDTSNHPLRRGQTYYILPSSPSPSAGGLTLGHRTTTLCPPYVTQSTSPTTAGLPLTFSPADPNLKLIPLSVDLNIAFAAATICVQSTAWRLNAGSSGKRYVSIGGMMGRPGLSTVSSWFRIEKYSDDGNGSDKSYKLVFCPGVCKECRVECGDLGVVEEDGGKRWVGISDVPLSVVFNKTS